MPLVWYLEAETPNNLSGTYPISLIDVTAPTSGYYNNFILYKHPNYVIPKLAQPAHPLISSRHNSPALNCGGILKCYCWSIVIINKQKLILCSLHTPYDFWLKSHPLTLLCTNYGSMNFYSFVGLPSSGSTFCITCYFLYVFYQFISLNHAWFFISFAPFTPSLFEEFDFNNLIKNCLHSLLNLLLILSTRCLVVCTSHFLYCSVVVPYWCPKMGVGLLSTHK